MGHGTKVPKSKYFPKIRKGNFFSDTSQKWPFHSVHGFVLPLVLSHWFGFCPLLMASQLLRSLKLAFSSAAPADAENGKIKMVFFFTKPQIDCQLQVQMLKFSLK